MTTTEPRPTADVATVAAELSSGRSEARAGLGGRISAYVALTKPRIIELLLVTTLPVMFLAAGGLPPLGLVDRDADRRHAGGRERQRPQLLLRPRHRRADAPDPSASAARPRGRAHGGARLRWGPRRAGHVVARPDRQLAVGVAGVGCQRVLRPRLHDVAQAADLAEHGLGRDRGLLPDADRLDCGDRPPGLGAVRALPRRLPVDAAAHLGAGDALPRGLRRRRSADASGGRGRARGHPADRGLHLGDRRGVVPPVAGGATWV